MRVQHVFKDPQGHPVLLIVSAFGSHLCLRWEQENGEDRELCLSAGEANHVAEMIAFIQQCILRDFPELVEPYDD